VTITRTKVSKGLASEEFLAPRQLQKTYDFQMRFSNMQGLPTGARVLAVISVAFAAVIAVFAF